MLILKDYNNAILREFTESQFRMHKELVETVAELNDFGEDTGINAMLLYYIALLNQIAESCPFNSSDMSFKLTFNQSILYDLAGELTRLCYKYSCPVSHENDWENEHP